MGRVTLVLGGARSGKSEVAEALVAKLGEAVTYVAAGPPPDAGADADWAARVAVHRARRPAAWTTVESGDILTVLAAVSGPVLLDSLGGWVARDGGAAEAPALARALTDRDGDTVVVSEEVGLGVHPATEVGRAFRDALGVVNQAVAAVAGDAWLVVAGRLVRLERP